jgi:predicted peptidase
MRLKFLISAILFLFMLSACSPDISRTDSPRQEARRLESVYEQKVDLNYLLYLPKNYNSDEKFPLMMFLHGAGERGDDLELVKKHGPPKLIEEGKDFPFIIVTPQCPKGIRWKTNSLIRLLDEVIKNYNVDEERIYITGISMGGYGTWKLANEIPGRLAAVIPICGWGDPWTICEIGDLPVWAFHGAKDNVVHPQRSQDLIESLKRCGGNGILTLYPDAAHDCWTTTYENPRIYEWLLEKTRSGRKKLNSNWF